ncbi:helicase-primase helicase subunit [Columbid alphaherpesvirus 1]|uniref:Helicase-primase helicase subunit n=1 Tax=Columbid alphaherpesvirus 1 TaxID=93386 RepID=A0A1V0M8E6_9ALPH|nr:helicase-primase helicase subunit [Columbid alphaherpesvirus 1]ARD71326.1 helicase-primase helicase subunit [Columbid alphaherpesvirus 1]
MNQDDACDDCYSDPVYLNFTSMHGIQGIVSRIRTLAGGRIEREKIPPLSWFKKAAELECPLDLELLELPFAAYLISGNAGSGKSTCLQTLSEVMDCVITGTTKVASQNVYCKLSNAYASPHINTIFQEFGFKGNHVQATLGKWQYVCPSNPPSIQELQKRDIVYYWEVLYDITRNAVVTSAKGDYSEKFETIRAVEELLGKPRGYLASAAFCIYGSLPAFTRSNVIVIDEAGLLGRHLLTAIVYCWWLTNAVYKSSQYEQGRVPVIVCVGSPTQTSSLESTFEHSSLKCNVRASENVLTYMICNRALRSYLDLPRNWAIFINNKRCTEPEFGDLMKALEYGLPITEEHARMADSFVVPEAFINNPANLPGWTRLYSSHKEVSTYMSRLHAHLKVAGDNRFVVFTLPVYTFIRMQEFEQYRQTASQPTLTVEKWMSANAGRLSNWSQSRDQDAAQTRCEIRSQLGLALACSDVTYVLNSQVAVTTRLRKWVFGFCGTFETFLSVLKDDSFIKTHGEGSIEYAYKFLSTIIFNGLINFYNYLHAPNLDAKLVDEAYERMGELTLRLLPGGQAGETAGAEAVTMSDVKCASASNESTFDFRGLDGGDASAFEDDAVFAALDYRMIDVLYCNYDFSRPETSSEIHAQFSMLKSLFMGRYAIMIDLFGPKFSRERFDTYVQNVSFKGCEMFASSLQGGLLSLALQTDNYTLMGYTQVLVHKLRDDVSHKRLDKNVTDTLYELNMPLMVLKDQYGFMSAVNVNINEFVDTVGDKELKMAITADYGISSKLAMTIARSQGLSLEKVAICFSRTGLRLNSVYVAMSRVVSSQFLRMNINPLRENYARDDNISEHILAALRDPNVHIVY